MTKCKVTDCPKDVRCQGYCAKHYTRFKRHGHPSIVHPKTNKPTASQAHPSNTPQRVWEMDSYRLRARLSQRELAGWLGYSPAVIYRANYLGTVSDRLWQAFVELRGY